jgi:hypothetical protein
MAAALGARGRERKIAPTPAEPVRPSSAPGKTAPIMVQATKPDPDLQAILDAFGIRLHNPVLRVTATPAA